MKTRDITSAFLFSKRFLFEINLRTVNIPRGSKKRKKIGASRRYTHFIRCLSRCIVDHSPFFSARRSLLPEISDCDNCGEISADLASHLSPRFTYPATFREWKSFGNIRYDVFCLFPSHAGIASFIEISFPVIFRRYFFHFFLSRDFLYQTFFSVSCHHDFKLTIKTTKIATTSFTSSLKARITIIKR